MSGRPDRWIVIPRWDEFQHYKDRDPIWIKDYVLQVRQDEWLYSRLSQRGVLWGLRLLYTETNGALSETGARQKLVRSASDARRWREHLEALNHAGFIELSASKPLASETETEKERTTAGEPTEGPTATPSPKTAFAEGFGNLQQPLLALVEDHGYGLRGAVVDLLRSLTDRDAGTEGVVWGLVRKHRLAEGDIRRAIEAAKGPGVRSRTRVAIAELKKARGAA